jgi:putative hydrolase of HD superfamily
VVAVLKLAKSDLLNLIDFFRMSGGLKRIPRSGWVEIGIDSPESVADHTFRTAILCMIFSDLEDLDELKMLQMALIHDLPEVITGDLTPSERTSMAKRREEDAMKELLCLLPERQKVKYANVWREYEECKTAEARAVRQLEKLEMALQGKEYECTELTKESLERFFKSAEKAIVSPTIKRLLSYILGSHFERV